MYSPDAGYTGPDEVTVRPKNYAGEGPPLTVQIDVTAAANEAPRCYGGWPLRLRTGASASVPIGCSDPDGDPLETTTDPAPQHGSISQGSPPFGGTTYTADDGYAGADSFSTFAEDDRGARSTKATQDVTIVGDDENTVPECLSYTARTRNDRSTSIQLRCFDAESDPMTFTWEDPAHGSVVKGTGMGLPGGGGYLVYTPDDDVWSGLDAVTFRAEDDHGGETVPITVLVEVIDLAAPDCRGPGQAQRAHRRRAAVIEMRCLEEQGQAYPTLLTDAEHGTVTDGTPRLLHLQARRRVQRHRQLHDPRHERRGQHGRGAGGRGRAGRQHRADLQLALERQRPVARARSPSRWGAPTRTSTSSRWRPSTNPTTARSAPGTARRARSSTHPTRGSWATTRSRSARATAAGTPTTVEQKVKVRSQDENKIPRCQSTGTYTPAGQPVTMWPWCNDGDGDPLTVAIAEAPEHGTAAVEDGKLKYTPDEGFQGDGHLRHHRERRPLDVAGRDHRRDRRRDAVVRSHAATRCRRTSRVTRRGASSCAAGAGSTATPSPRSWPARRTGRSARSTARDG